MKLNRTYNKLEAQYWCLDELQTKTRERLHDIVVIYQSGDMEKLKEHMKMYERKVITMTQKEYSDLIDKYDEPNMMPAPFPIKYDGVLYTKCSGLYNQIKEVVTIPNAEKGKMYMKKDGEYKEVRIV